jgi:hypothetical protein
VAPIAVSVPHVKIVLPDAGQHEVRLLDEVERVDADGRVQQSNGDRLRKAAGSIATTAIRSRDAWLRASSHPRQGSHDCRRTPGAESDLEKTPSVLIMKWPVRGATVRRSRCDHPRGETTSWTLPLIGDVFVVRSDGSGGAVDGH